MPATIGVTTNLEVSETLTTSTLRSYAGENLTLGCTTGGAAITITTSTLTVTLSKLLRLDDTTDASDATGTTGSLGTKGGLSVVKKTYIGDTFTVTKTNSAASGIQDAIYVEGTLSSSGTASLRGVYVALTADTNGGGSSGLIGSINVTGSGTPYSAIPLTASLLYSGTGGVSDIANVIQSSANLNQSGSPSGVFSNLTLFYGAVSRSGGNATVTNGYGLNLYPPSGSYVTNAYGIYVGNVTAATNAYSIYTGTGIVRFGDTTDATTTDGTTGAVRSLGGLSVAKTGWFGTNLTLGAATSTLTLGVTNTGSLAVNSDGALTITPKSGQVLTVSGGLTVTSTLTLSGTAANIAVGSNYISNGGTDAGISLDSNNNATISGDLTVTGGNVVIGGSLSAADAISLVTSTLTGVGQCGIRCNPVFSSAATTSGSSIIAKVSTAAAAYTMVTGIGLAIDPPTLGASSSITSNIGIYVNNQGAAGITNAYGIDIAAQSGAATINVGLRNAGTSQFTETTDSSSSTTGSATFAGGVGIAKKLYVGTDLAAGGNLTVSVGTIGIGGAAGSATCIYIQNTGLVGNYQYSILSNPVFSSTADTKGYGIYSKVQTEAASFTMGDGYAFYAAAPTIGTASAITSLYGLYIANQGKAGITNAYGIDIAAQSGAATVNVGLRNAGTSQFTETTDSSSSTTGSATFAGGVGIAKKLYVGTDLAAGGNLTASGTGSHTFGTTSTVTLAAGKITSAITGEAFISGNTIGPSSNSFLTQKGTTAAAVAQTWYAGINVFATDGSYEIKDAGQDGISIGVNGALTAASSGSHVFGATNTVTLAAGTIVAVPVARTSGIASYFKITIPTDTGQTANTESIGFNLATGTRTWADGTVAVQREVVFEAPTYAKTTSAATFTKAATVAITNAPQAGADVTLTNPYAFWVQAGSAQFDGGLVSTTGSFSSTLGAAATTVTSNAAAALTVGLNGATNPALTVDASTASSATGVKVKSAAAAGGVAVSVTSSGTDENLTIDAKGAGTVTIAGTSTGGITLTRDTTVSGDLQVTGGDIKLGGAAGAATTSHKLVKKITSIADNTATDILTVTVPNANHAALVKLTLLTTNGGTDAFESSRTSTGEVVLARTSGVDTVAAASALVTQIATVGSGATHTTAVGCSAMTGAADAQQTFTIQVTINDSGDVGSNQCVVIAELLNAEATGVTIA